MAIETLGGGDGDHFDPAQFDAELASHGTPGRWRPARRCPCADPKTGAPDPNCIYCREYPGTIWSDAVVPGLRVLAAARRRQDLYDQNGHLLKGVVTLTFPSTLLPAHLDQIELTAAVMVVNTDQHVRGQTDPAHRSTERLRLLTVLDVDACEAIVGGILTPYSMGADFTLDDTNGITWTADAGPPTGTIYTVRYTARPVYVCWSPESRDENAIKQPYRCTAQRLDFFLQPTVA